MIKFEYPFLFVLFFVPFLVRYLLPSVKGLYGNALKIPFISDFENIENIANRKANFFSLNHSITVKWLALLSVWLLMVLAAMRPILIGKPIRINEETRDILMVTDISTSMLEDDFSFNGQRLNRLSAVKAVMSDFVNRRISDRLGLILFGTRAYLQAPLTYDRNTIQEILWSMDAGMAGNSTAIGDALALALKTLKDSKENLSNKVIILLTDGENNDGSISFPQAILMAKNEGVKVYTIGVGGQGFSSFAKAFLGNIVSNLDEAGLKQLADETKGRYFRADDLNSLIEIYKVIDLLEPITTEQNYIYPRKELFYIPIVAAIIFSAILMYWLRSL